MDYFDKQRHDKAIADKIWTPNCPDMLSDDDVEKLVDPRKSALIGGLFGQLRVLGMKSPYSKNGRTFVVRCSCGIYGTEHGDRLTRGLAVGCYDCKQKGIATRRITAARWTRGSPKILPFDCDNPKIGKTYAFISVLGKSRGPKGLGWAVRCACGTYGVVDTLGPYQTGKRICCPYCRIYFLQTFSEGSVDAPPNPSWWPEHKDVLKRLDAIVSMAKTNHLTCDSVVGED